MPCHLLTFLSTMLIKLTLRIDGGRRRVLECAGIGAVRMISDMALHAIVSPGERKSYMLPGSTLPFLSATFSNMM